MNQEKLIVLLKALSDPVRLSIVKLLSSQPDLSASALLEQLHITQSTLSFHMKKLVDSGIVRAQKEGTWMKYQLNAWVEHLLKMLFESESFS